MNKFSCGQVLWAAVQQQFIMAQVYVNYSLTVTLWQSREPGGSQPQPCCSTYLTAEPCSTSEPTAVVMWKHQRFDKVRNHRTQIWFHWALAHCCALEPQRETQYRICGQRKCHPFSQKCPLRWKQLVILTLIVNYWADVWIVLVTHDSPF